MDRVLTIIMAGGEGTRLSVLAVRRAKPAVPFGGIFRIIDFSLSNVMHSGLRVVGIVTQYRPYSLIDHVGLGEWWGLQGQGRMVKFLSPHTGNKDAKFYGNTADAIYRNIEFLERFPQTTEVLILSADHIYKMDYRDLVQRHRDRRASLTIATQTVPWEETSRFGIMVTNADGRITQFQEKPQSNPLSNKASLGIYVFDRACLLDALRKDAVDPNSEHDFGGDIIPRLIASEPVYDYDFPAYWRDVGTIPSYVQTQMEVLNPETSGLDLGGWGVRTNHYEIKLRHQHATRIVTGSAVEHSVICQGSLIEGTVTDSILSPGVRVGRGAIVRRSILLHDVSVGEGATLDDVIADKHVRIGRGAQIGNPELGDAVNEFKPHLLCTGTTVLGKGAIVPAEARLGRNALVYPMVELKSGTHRSGCCYQEMD